MIDDLAKRARAAARELLKTSGAERRAGILAIADRLVADSAELIAANKKDLAAILGPVGQKDATDAFCDRLMLDESRIKKMADGVRTVAGLIDPVGEIVKGWALPNGLRIEQTRVPIGVILVIYESRPNVTADAASITLKSGNAIILRGGKEAFHSNRAIAGSISRALESVGLPGDAVLFVDSTERSVVQELLQLEGRIDLVIPRGGEGLIKMVVENSKIPVIYHGAGICHIYVDASADIEMALKVAKNAKCQRPGVCNAMETLLVHKDIAGKILPKLSEALKGVELRGCSETLRILPGMKAATDADWKAEYLDLILAIRVVDSLAAAIEHIETHGSHLADAIITREIASAERFTRQVDSAAVYVNTSTRFTDGGEFGFGAEIGISTQKLHARGPMGPAELTTTKFVVRGEGQIRE